MPASGNAIAMVLHLDAVPDLARLVAISRIYLPVEAHA